MRAIVLTEYGDPDVLRLATVPDPVPGPGQVAIAVRAAGVNRADLLQRLGRYPAPDPKPVHEIPGLEAAGEVAALGEGVRDWRPGDRVMALLPGGGYAERVVVSDRMLIPIPADWGFETGAAFPEAFLTAYDALRQLSVSVGDWVLVHATASGVGTSAVQLATAMGARVIGTCGTDEKAARVAALGATRVVNYQREDFLAVCREMTGGRGVDAIVDLVGGSYLERNLQALSVRGRQIVVGTVGGHEASINLGMILGRRLQLMGTALRSRAPEEKMQLTQAVRRHVGPLLESGRAVPVLDRVFPWAEAPAAHRRMEANLNIGKIVLAID